MFKRIINSLSPASGQTRVAGAMHDGLRPLAPSKVVYTVADLKAELLASRPLTQNGKPSKRTVELMTRLNRCLRRIETDLLAWYERGNAGAAASTRAAERLDIDKDMERLHLAMVLIDCGALDTVDLICDLLEPVNKIKLTEKPKAPREPAPVASQKRVRKAGLTIVKSSNAAIPAAPAETPQEPYAPADVASLG